MKAKIETEDCRGRKRVIWAPVHLAWIVARAIAEHSYDEPKLTGARGSAVFERDGSSVVRWNQTGEIVRYSRNTTAAICGERSAEA